jgi:hypothetical protein
MRAGTLFGSAVIAAVLAWPLAAQEVRAGEEPQKSSEQRVKYNRRTRVRLGGIFVGVGYSRYSGYGYYPWRYYPGLWGPWPYYSWGWYDPWFIHPGYYSGFARGGNMGEIKLKAEPRHAEVYIDGAYAGAVADLKSMWLEPGAYNLEIRDDSRAFRRRVYVLSGKTLRIDAELAPESQEERP